MWLDRFSNQPPPGSSPPPSRSSFQAQRRQGHQVTGAPARPGFSPRSSSLNVAKFNASTTSLNSPRLLPNGSGLRQEIPPPPDLTDPLAVLQDIVGQPLVEEDGNGMKAENSRKPTSLIEDVKFDGRTLQEFMDDRDVKGGEEVESALTIEECEYVCPSCNHQKYMTHDI